jgi:hypothetical protein
MELRSRRSTFPTAVSGTSPRGASTTRFREGGFFLPHRRNRRSIHCVRDSRCGGSRGLAPVDLMTRREGRVPLFVSVGASRVCATNGAGKPECAQIQAREAFPDPGASNVHAETEGRDHRLTLAAAPSSSTTRAGSPWWSTNPPEAACGARCSRASSHGVTCARRATLRWTQWACPVGGLGRARDLGKPPPSRPPPARLSPCRS